MSSEKLADGMKKEGEKKRMPFHYEDAPIKGSTEINEHIEKLLHEDEKVIWDGMPNIHKIFSKQDAFLIPLGIFWIALGVAFFVVAITMVGVASNGIVMNGFLGFIGMLSCLFGLYALIGRPIYKRYWKRHTWFAVTDSRILILSKAKISEQSLWDLHKLDVSIDAKGIGTILFGREYADLNKPTFYRRNGNMAVFDFFIGNGIPDAFYDIDDARDVYHLISDLIAQ